MASNPLIAVAQVPQGEAPAPGQPQPQQQAPAGQAQPPKQEVVATVNGDPITRQEVQATLQPQLQGRQVDPQAVQQIEKRVIDNLVQSRLVEQYVLEKGPDVEPKEVQATVDRLKQQLAQQQVPLEQFLVAQGHTPESFQDRIKGSLAWQKYQKQQLTDENLKRFFEGNQQRFDAQSFEEARPAVSQAYISELWNGIVGEMKPKAEIRVTPSAPNQPPAAQPPRQSAPQGFPQQ